MKTILKASAKYLLRLLIPVVLGVLFFVLDFLGAVERFAPGCQFPKWLEWLLSPPLLFMLILVIANGIIYVRQEQKMQSLRNRIAEIEATEANLHLKVIEGGFRPAGTSTLRPFPDIEVNPMGYDENGVPGWARIWARIKIENRGWEPGCLVYDFDHDKAILPAIFDCGFVFDSAVSNQMFQDSKYIEGKTSTAALLYLNVRIIERDPQAFAQSLNTLDRYCVVMKYKTNPKVGEPRAHGSTLCIEGDFEDFRQEILQYWEQSHKHNLVRLAKSE